MRGEKGGEGAGRGVETGGEVGEGGRPGSGEIIAPSKEVLAILSQVISGENREEKAGILTECFFLFLFFFCACVLIAL